MTNHLNEKATPMMSDEAFRSFLEELLRTRTMSVIDYRLDETQEKCSPEQREVLLQIYRSRILDIKYALCYEALGRFDEAKVLRDFVESKKNRI